MRNLFPLAAAAALAVTACGGGATREDLAMDASRNTSGGEQIPQSGNTTAAGASATNPIVQAAAARCEQQLASAGQLPPNVDASRLCACALDTALSENDDPGFMQTAAGGQALMQSVLTCLREETGEAPLPARGSSRRPQHAEAAIEADALMPGNSISLANAADPAVANMPYNVRP